jgi:peptidoglycan/xylan/chitin deacetylase (PgdA/CDA1 family)
MSVTGKRGMAATLFGRLGVTATMAAVRKRFFGEVTILAYHRILDVESEDDFPFDIELVSASISQFSDQMEHIKANYNPITFATLLQHLDRGEKLPRAAAIVTFDDGFADNYHNAFPVLKRLEMPATIFLATGNIDHQEPFWYEKLSFAFMTTRATAIHSPTLGSLAISDAPQSRRELIKCVIFRLKLVPDDVRLSVLEDLYEQLGPEIALNGDKRSGPMTWEQVKLMAANNIEFGSHSVTHPVLSRVPLGKLAHEVEHSKQRIETELQKPVDVIAYPVGGVEAFDDNVRSAVKKAGYRLGVSYVAGIERPDQWDTYALRRVHVERYVDDHFFKAMLAAPELFV